MNVSELREQTVELLPAREALSRVHVTVAKVYAYNSAVALNVGSWCSSATAVAGQTIVIG
ncbi:MAG: hypothetical protein ACRDVE_16115 [Actinocrinis sp.]